MILAGLDFTNLSDHVMAAACRYDDTEQSHV